MMKSQSWKGRPHEQPRYRENELIPTLCDYLFIVNRDRAKMQDKLDKRKAFVLTCALFLVVTIGVLAWILNW